MQACAIQGMHGPLLLCAAGVAAQAPEKEKEKKQQMKAEMAPKKTTRWHMVRRVTCVTCGYCSHLALNAHALSQEIQLAAHADHLHPVCKCCISTWSCKTCAYAHVMC